ncbi:MAG: TadE/TadG family type IV pilus assembly protein [Telluria sp.]
MKARRIRRMGGAAAVEMALVVCLGFFIVPVVLLFGRILWTYQVLKQSTFDAALIYGSVPLATMLDGTSATTLEATARATVNDALANAGTAQVSSLSQINVLCSQCQGTPVQPVTVSLDYLLPATFPNWTIPYLSGIEGNVFQISVHSTIPYAIRPLTP